MSQDKKWIVTTSGDRPLRDVVKRLTENGFVVVQVLGEIGCIIGTANEDEIKRIRTIPGIADISPDTAIELGPPDALLT